MEEKLDKILAYSLLAAKNVLTMEDASLLTGLRKATLYSMTCKRQIPYYKKGRIVYFDRAELETWMKQNRVATQQETERNAIAYVVTGKQKGGAQ